MPIIIRLIMAGVPAVKIIAKYGKKAYDAAKVAMKSKDKSVWSKLSKKDAEKFILNPVKQVEKKKIKKLKKEFKRPIRIATLTGLTASEVENPRKYRFPLRKQGGTVSKYSTGGGVRKSKYSL
jgi:uncharacterized protein YaeQ